MRYRAFIIAVLTVGLAFSYSYAQQPEIVGASVVAEPTADDIFETQDEDQSQAQVASEDGNVTLDFREADIRNVLRILSYKSGINIVPGPEVAGLVTIQLTDVPWEQALSVILETHGYGYERNQNIIIVTTVDNLKKRREDRRILAEQEKLTTKTYVLNYAKSENIVGSIQKMLTPRGNINYDVRTNALIVRDTPSNLEIIDGIIPTLDATTPQVLIEAKIIETTLNDSENLGIDWTLGATVSASGRSHFWPFSNNSDHKYLSGDTSADPTSAGFNYGSLDLSTLQAVLEILKTRTDTNILSNPRIVTLDNQKATINVGSQFPLPEYTYNEEQAQMQVSGWEYMDIGITFDVTPHVNKAGYVTLDIHPTITEDIGDASVEGTTLPILSNESVTTRVMIKEGETLVIGGLIKDKITDTREKVPILGDIPVLGYLFQKKEKTTTKTDLLIFITPYIITADLENSDF